MEIGADKANILIFKLREFSPSSSDKLDANSWLDFCHQLRGTALSDQSSHVENMINEFIKKHFPLSAK